MTEQNNELMQDKNGRTMRTGDIVKIENAHFKSDNGYYYIDRAPGDASWCGSDYSLHKISKRGKISAAKYSIAFWPLSSYCSDQRKNAEAHEHNKKYATIEVVFDIDRSEVIAHFEQEAQHSEEAVKTWAWRFGEDSETVTKEKNIAAYQRATVERMRTEDGTKNKTMPEPAATSAAFPDMFEELAKAYITGKQAPKAPEQPEKEQEKEQAPEQPEEPETVEKQPEKPQKIGYGYTGEASNLFVKEDIGRLVNGVQVCQTGRPTNYFFTTPYHGETKLVYSLCPGYGSVSIPAGLDARYAGFITSGRYYDSTTAICAEMSDDINAEIMQRIPDEETAEKAAGELTGYTSSMKAYDYRSDASRYYYDGTIPELALYKSDKFSTSDIIAYIEDPVATVERIATDYIDDHKVNILERYIRYSRILQSLEVISTDKTAIEHKISRIIRNIDKEKTVKIQLSNGKTVRVEASAVKNLKYGGYISDLYVIASDRQYLDKTDRGRNKNILPDDIVKITHGCKVLYDAS